MNKPVQWRVAKGRFETGSLAFVGPIKVANVFRGIGTKSAPDAPLWQIEFRLPGMAYPRAFQTEDEAREMTEKMVRQWFGYVSE